MLAAAQWMLDIQRFCLTCREVSGTKHEYFVYCDASIYALTELLNLLLHGTG
jgi:hypothetical protein